jgi:hypothetical protein
VLAAAAAAQAVVAAPPAPVVLAVAATQAQQQPTLKPVHRTPAAAVVACQVLPLAKLVAMAVQAS